MGLKTLANKVKSTKEFKTSALIKRADSFELQLRPDP